MQKKEIAIENEMIDAGVNKYRVAVAKAKKARSATDRSYTTESCTTYGVALLKNCVQDIAKQLDADILENKGRPGKGRRPIAWEYLAKLDTATCAYISAKTLIDSISSTTVLSTLASKIANKIEDQARLDTFALQDKKYYRASLKYAHEVQHAETYRKKRKVLLAAAKRRPDVIKPWVAWPTKDKLHIGCACLMACIRATSSYDTEHNRIPETGIAEIKLARNAGGKGRVSKSTYLVYGTEKTLAIIEANQDVCQFFAPEFLPCVQEPIEWTTPFNGGYHLAELRKRKPLVKIKGGTQEKYLNLMQERGVTAMPDFYDAVNALQKTPWKVNSFVLEQALKEFGDGTGTGIGMPPNSSENVIARPSFLIDKNDNAYKEQGLSFRVACKENRKTWTEDQKSEYIAWTVAIKKQKQAEVARVSILLNYSKTLKIAKKYEKQERFYFVYTADLVGRLYVAGTALSPQGTDMSKGLLTFANGKALGENGLFHLCVYAAGCYGQDKGSLDDRVNWIMVHKDVIIDTYAHPDANRDFWGKAKKPFCFLGCCKELGQVLALGTIQEQEKFVSYIPCAQDGSCNGIQHYSAMLRDNTGAGLVNLLDGDVPSDIYQRVADRTTEYIQHALKTDTSFDGKTWEPALAQEREIAQGWLDLGITRACTKKPTMVLPYGGTKIGCRSEIKKYLSDVLQERKQENPNFVDPFAKIDTYVIHEKEDGKQEAMKTDPDTQAVKWLTNLVWAALDQEIIAARKAMAYLKKTMSAVQSTSKQGVSTYMTAPTGFRSYLDPKMTEPYRVRTHLDGQVQLKMYRDIEDVDKRKMLSSIAPNFVHMLDASHLQITVTHAAEAGISDFACVHDSYATHACNCSTLHKVLREAFVQLHSEPVLEIFRQEQKKLHPACVKHLTGTPCVKNLTGTSCGKKEKAVKNLTAGNYSDSSLDSDALVYGDFDINQVKYSKHFFR